MRISDWSSDVCSSDLKIWTKTAQPVFKSANGVYATGHNGFFQSPDGKESWIIYHANPGPGMKCTSARAPHIQRFGWSEAGWPEFGEPVASDTPRSEEHTSELQSLMRISYAVFCLKKKKSIHTTP